MPVIRRVGGEFALKSPLVYETSHDNAAASYNAGSQQEQKTKHRHELAW